MYLAYVRNIGTLTNRSEAGAGLEPGAICEIHSLT
jgi:hypothetical protein